jgi:hypothetical protein
MLAVLFLQPGKFALNEVPKPEIGARNMYGYP